MLEVYLGQFEKIWPTKTFCNWLGGVSWLRMKTPRILGSFLKEVDRFFHSYLAHTPWPVTTFFYKSLETHSGSGNLISAGIAG